MRIWLFFALALCACRAPASTLSKGTVLSYGVGHRDGEASLRIYEDGTAEYHSTFDPAGPIDARAKVTPTELRALAAVLRKHDFCGLRSARSTGVPDEARPSIAVRLEELDCEVELWDNEWRSDEDAKACLHAVESFGQRVADRGGHKPKSDLPPGEVLRYGVSHRDGAVTIVLRADGTAEYTSEGRERLHLRDVATARELEQLTTVLQQNDFCALRSKRNEGVPDEAKPTIAVRLQGLDCQITLWDGEWSEDPKASACIKAVEGFGLTLRKRAQQP